MSSSQPVDPKSLDAVAQMERLAAKLQEQFSLADNVQQTERLSDDFEEDEEDVDEYYSDEESYANGEAATMTSPESEASYRRHHPTPYELWKASHVRENPQKEVSAEPLI